MSLPVIHGTSAANYPLVQTYSFRTIIGQFQNGAQQRMVAQPGALLRFEIPYAQLTQAQKDTVKAAVAAAQGQFATNLALTIGATTYSNLSLESDEFSGTEGKPTVYGAPLVVSQTVTQNLAPGTAGQPFPALANGAMSQLPYSQRKRYQTVSTKLPTGPKYTTPEFAAGLAAYPTDGLMAWTLEERGLNDTDLATRVAHFIANYGRAFSFNFTDEDSVVYASTHYASDQMVIRSNGVNDSSVTTVLESTSGTGSALSPSGTATVLVTHNSHQTISVNMTMAANVAGSTIAVLVGVLSGSVGSPAATTPAVSDSNNPLLTYTQATWVDGNLFAPAIGIFYVSNVAAGTNTITFSATAINYNPIFDLNWQISIMAVELPSMPTPTLQGANTQQSPSPSGLVSITLTDSHSASITSAGGAGPYGSFAVADLLSGGVDHWVAGYALGACPFAPGTPTLTGGTYTSHGYNIAGGPYYLALYTA